MNQPERGSERRYQQVKAAGGTPSLEDYDAHSARVRSWYARDVEHSRALSRERGRRFRARQAQKPETGA